MAWIFHYIDHINDILIFIYDVLWYHQASVY